MTELLTALQTAFNANSSLTSVFSNGLENVEGADLDHLPNCVLLVVSAVPEYSTGTAYTEPVYIQFTVRSTSGTVCQQALNNLEKTFDHKALTLSTETVSDARRSGGLNRVTKEDERVFRGDVEYRFTVDRSLS